MQDRLGNKIRLLHIIDAINEIENYIQDSDLKTFTGNSMMFNATLRQLEIIGEASNRLSEEILNENPIYTLGKNYWTSQSSYSRIFWH